MKKTLFIALILINIIVILIGILYTLNFYKNSTVKLREIGELSDQIPPRIKYDHVASDYHIDNGILSIFSIEELDFSNTDIRSNSYEILDSNGYYYEVVYPLERFKEKLLNLKVFDNSQNAYLIDDKVNRISRYDQNFNIGYNSSGFDSKVLTKISYNTLLGSNRRLYAAYKPIELVSLKELGIPGNPGVMVEKTAGENLLRLFEDIKKEGIDFYVTSGYRSFQDQIYTYNFIKNQSGKEYADKVVALPGHSEHQLGLAVDIVNNETSYKLPSGSVQTRLYSWLQDNAEKYGYIQTYDGSDEEIIEEIWHWRYVGE